MKHSFKDFIPLVALLALVGILTYVGTTQWSQPPMQAFMGYFFILFGLLKVIRLPHFVMAYQSYDIIAKNSKAYGYLYPFLELGFGIALLLSWNVPTIAVLIAIVMIISALGVLQKLLQKEDIPCACMGTVFKVPMTWVTLGEDLVMATMALYLMV